MSRKAIAYIVLTAILAATACRKEAMPVQEESLYVPMAFSTTNDEVYEFTKSDALVDKTSHETMRVWATRTASAGNTTYMDGYKVQYTSSEGWRYDNVAGQSMKYWDWGATSFRFHAGAPYTAVTAMSANSLTLKMAPTKDVSGTALYSSPSEVGVASSAFGNAVSLNFNQAYCRVQVRVKLSKAQTGDVTVSNIALIPNSPNTYPVSANLNVSYDWAAGTCSTSLSNITSSSSKKRVEFGSVAMVAPGTSEQVTSTPYWYMIPTANGAATWTLYLKINGVVRQTGIGATSGSQTERNKWEPGKSYIYTVTVDPEVLSISDITVEPWTDEDIYMEIGD